MRVVTTHIVFLYHDFIALMIINVFIKNANKNSTDSNKTSCIHTFRFNQNLHKLTRFYISHIQISHQMLFVVSTFQIELKARFSRIQFHQTNFKINFTENEVEVFRKVLEQHRNIIEENLVANYFLSWIICKSDFSTKWIRWPSSWRIITILGFPLTSLIINRATTILIGSRLYSILPIAKKLIWFIIIQYTFKFGLIPQALFNKIKQLFFKSQCELQKKSGDWLQDCQQTIESCDKICDHIFR